uniref:Uncharacterized protein n=1 Tax=Rhizophagus irregularis (strain DAOM 181602 / DAOM 197198 / MUCL 43194) TaxID=747089 RepID=U9U2Q5_RHIID
MPHFVVHVEKARKIVISSRIMKVDIKSKTFNDIFEQLTTGKFYLRQVKHFGRSFKMDLQFDVAVTIYQYHQGNYLGTLNYIWKVPSCFNNRDETKLVQIMASLQKLLPKFTHNKCEKMLFIR